MMRRAASGNGGSVRPAGDEQAMPIAVARRDFSFDPEKRDFRVESGGERFGNSFDDWGKDLAELRDAIPEDHRRFLANLPWVAEAEGHVFIHNGLSPELDCPAAVQLECLRRKVWDRSIVNPKFGTDTDRLFTPDYPVWIGADRKLSENPLPVPGRLLSLRLKRYSKCIYIKAPHEQHPRNRPISSHRPRVDQPAGAPLLR